MFIVYLNETFLKLWRDYYYNNSKDIRLGERSSYFWGLQKGIEEKLNKSKEQTENQRFEQIKEEKGTEIVEKIKNEYALVLVNQNKRIKDSVKQYYPRLGTKKRGYTSNISRNAYEDGKTQGKNININRAITSGNQTHLKE